MRFNHLALLLFILSSCQSAIAVQRGQGASTLQKISETEIGADAKIEKNESGTFALVYKNENRSVTYIVVRMADLKIVINKKVITGSVTWSGDMQIKESTVPGIIKKNSRSDDNIRYIDLKNFINER
jgi:hypothetical protein